MANKALAATLIALLAVLPAGQALAQAQAAPAKAAGMVVQSGEPKATKTSTHRKAPTKVNEDARHCLDLGTTAEIVKCAEPYRY